MCFEHKALDDAIVGVQWSKLCCQSCCTSGEAPLRFYESAIVTFIVTPPNLARKLLILQGRLVGKR